MKKDYFSIFAFLVIAILTLQAVSAQFPIKIPKLPKKELPKLEQTKIDDTQTLPTDDGKNQNSTNQTGGGRSANINRLKASNKPVLLKDTLEVKAYRNNYGKSIEQTDYWSWLPQISFFIFYDNSSIQRYTAEWFNPDGSLWFSETLKYGLSGGEEIIRVSSEHPTVGDRLKYTVITTGTYSFKITNAKSGEVVFQGKFRVSKLPPIGADARSKNHFMFYVEHDWLLPVGYVGYEYDTNWEAPVPTVWMWFKDQLQGEDFEARLFYNNRQIASTDDNCSSGTCIETPTQERKGDCLVQQELCSWYLWKFKWKNFITINTNYDFYKNNVPNTTATNDSPGEYTVKIYYKNAQVREAKFTVDAKGGISPNAFSNQIYLTNHKVAVPVKVLGTLDKWNPAAWKTEMFYGNPLTGFNIP